jgi:hypothetical protein
MHPELLRALAKARHADLLSESRTHGYPRTGPDDHLPRFARARQWAGSLLIWAGGRLIGDKRDRLELTHKYGSPVSAR